MPDLGKNNMNYNVAIQVDDQIIDLSGILSSKNEESAVVRFWKEGYGIEIQATKTPTLDDYSRYISKGIVPF